MPVITDTPEDVGGLLGSIGGFLGDNAGLLDNLLGTGLSAAGINELMSQYDNTSGMIREDIGGLIDTARTEGTFTPFGVTSATGTTGFDDQGNLAFTESGPYGALSNLSRDLATTGLSGAGSQDPTTQAQAERMASLSSGMGTGAPSIFGDIGSRLGTQATGALDALNVTDRAGRESQIFDRIRAMQAPEEARAQSSLDRRLMAQGRSGVRTNEFGGTPEQLALSKAKQEAMNTAAFQSMNQAGTEMDRDLGRALGLSGQALGTQGLGQQYESGALGNLFNVQNQRQGLLGGDLRTNFVLCTSVSAT